VAIPSYPFISSPLGLVPKHDGDFRRIHHLSHPAGRSVNDNIPDESSAIQYVRMNQIFNSIIQAGRGCVVIKKDVEAAFRTVPIAPHERHLVGFEWEKIFYTENCLPFGLCTAPFLFNLFAEAFYWILESFFY
jgi:hypothetical protein